MINLNDLILHLSGLIIGLLFGFWFGVYYARRSYKTGKLETSRC